MQHNYKSSNKGNVGKLFVSCLLVLCYLLILFASSRPFPVVHIHNPAITGKIMLQDKMEKMHHFHQIFI